ncbi:YcnI family protein [Geodermatophilus sp. FMUSA9-8]|uniref:YcnI family protein n=1 Tax=Geodermatophilus sp. FMUSA9-8 TaxID=3120155 RepID=UPI00300A88E8
MSPTSLRPGARAGVVLAALLAALVASVAGAAGASAHVTVSSADAAAGGYGKLTFRVPNESDTASTVALRISVPEDAAMVSLRAQPVPGWTVTTTSAQLAEPVEVHGQEISTYVSVVEFRADAGGGIAPGQFQEFSLSGGPFPDAATLSYPAVQTYSDGTESAWIEPTVDGQEEPESPAPVLTLAGGDAATAAGTDTAASDGHGHGGPVSNEPAGLALFVAILALAVGLAGVVLGYRAGRRTVSS